MKQTATWHSAAVDSSNQAISKDFKAQASLQNVSDKAEFPDCN